MKDKIDTIKKWFKPIMTKQNIALFICCVLSITLIILLGVFGKLWER